MIAIDRVMDKLDSHLHRNDYAAAQRHLIYWLDEARMVRDSRAELFILNELMGLYRKTGKRDEAIDCAKKALCFTENESAFGSIAAATTYINAATVYKAFSMPEESIILFDKACVIYERELPENDARLGGLYNNMALTLTDLSRFDEAEDTYKKAIKIVEKLTDREGEMAISYLNLANLVEKKSGLADGDEQIRAYLDIAEELLEKHKRRDGYYAFVCEKCASVFGYFGRFLYEKTLRDRAREIYEREGRR